MPQQEPFDRGVKWLIMAIDLCLKNNLHAPALILIYASIDIMAWLSRPEGQADVEYKDFFAWVENYLLPNSGPQCNAEDLYGARCGWLHSFTSESRRSRKGRARQIFYSWGVGRPEDLQEWIDVIRPQSGTIAIHIGQLFDALLKGIELFTQDLMNDLNLANRVYDRAGEKFFKDIPPLKLGQFEP